jgi:hypothetical protein
MNFGKQIEIPVFTNRVFLFLPRLIGWCTFVTSKAFDGGAETTKNNGQPVRA